jgi:iron complex outermembrane recepter protein
MLIADKCQGATKISASVFFRKSLPSTVLAFFYANVAAQELMIEEIMVTATTRPESMQDIPIAVSAFTGDAIEEAGVKDIRDIAGQTPGLSIKSRGDTEASVFIRGIGSQTPAIGADPAVGIYIDGVYAARGTNATAAFFDVERVEIVKGPQGTLFGRNASAGAIAIITRKPEIGESYGSALLGFGDEGQQKYEFIYNASLSDSTALRFGAKHDRRDGLYFNGATGKELNGRDNLNVRLSFLYDARASYTSHLSAEYIEFANTAGFVGPAEEFIGEVRQDDSPADQSLESVRVNWTNAWDLSDNTLLTSITGYYSHDVNVTPVDADKIELFVASFEEPQDARFFSQELRLNVANDRWDWFVGASYVTEKLSFRNNLAYDEFILADIFGLNAIDIEGDACNGTIDFGDGNGPVPVPVCLSNAVEQPSGNGETTSWAVYADTSWRVSDRFNIHAGVRYTEDDKELTYRMPSTGGLLGDADGQGNFGLNGQIFGPVTVGPINAIGTYSSTDPRVALNFHVSDGVMLYVSGAKGYKSGGLNRTVDPGTLTILPFEKEESTTYEAGIKSSLFGGRGQLNAAVFRNDYDNFQLSRLTNMLPQVENVGDVEVSGLDLDFRFLLTDAFEIWGSLSLLDTEVVNAVDSSLLGNKSVQAPEKSGSLAGKYSIPAGSGDVDITAIYMYSESFFFDLENIYEQPSYSTLDARIAWSSDKWGIALAGENLTDEEYLTDTFDFLGDTVMRGPGRLIRLEATLNF